MLKLNILKVGGAVVEDDAALDAFIGRFSALDGLKLLVHGGGRTANDLASRLGIQTVMVGGRRVTDADTLKLVTSVYAGLVNKNIVAKLQGAGVKSFGICGADFGCIRSVRRPVTPEGVDYGFVGDVVDVDYDAISLLLFKNCVPVVAPITCDMNGQLLNTNADTVASELASALSRIFDVTLTFCFEKEGVLDADGRLIPRIDSASFEALKADGTVSGGMLPKLENAFAALRRGVSQVRIASASAPDAGTSIVL